MLRDPLLGRVESFDGERLAGWVGVHPGVSEAGVDIYVDDVLVANAAATNPRSAGLEVPSGPQRARFEYRFPERFCAPNGPLILPNIPRVTVKLAKTDLALSVDDDLRGVLNVEEMGLAEWFLLFSNNAHLPVPEESLRAHVAGEGVTAKAYRSVGLFVAYDLMQLGLLRPTSRVVDLGCGCGRVATHIAPVVSESGRYWGFDTWVEGVRWATRNITSVYPSVTFSHLNDASKRPKSGYLGDRSFRLPLESGSADVAVCASLFTHLSFDAALSYLIELKRILQPSGRIFFSCFLYDDEAISLLKEMRLSTDERGAYAQHAGFFDSYYSQESFEEMFSRAGMRPVLFRYGHWRGDRYRKRRPIAYQDLFVLRPIGG